MLYQRKNVTHPFQPLVHSDSQHCSRWCKCYWCLCEPVPAACSALRRPPSLVFVMSTPQTWACYLAQLSNSSTLFGIWNSKWTHSFYRPNFPFPTPTSSYIKVVWNSAIQKLGLQVYLKLRQALILKSNFTQNSLVNELKKKIILSTLTCIC